jgi:hypothetical protein
MAKTAEEKAADKAKKDAEKAAKAAEIAAAPSPDNTAPAAAAPVAETEVKEAPANASKTEVTVKYRDHKGEPTERTFSKEVHGEDFAKLAEEFKATNASRIIA